jgi:hypothetical protein
LQVLTRAAKNSDNGVFLSAEELLREISNIHHTEIKLQQQRGTGSRRDSALYLTINSAGRNISIAAMLWLADLLPDSNLTQHEQIFIEHILSKNH